MSRKELKPAEFTAEISIKIVVPRWRWNDGSETSTATVNKELQTRLPRWLKLDLDEYLNQSRPPRLKVQVKARSKKYAVKGSK